MFGQTFGFVSPILSYPVVVLGINLLLYGYFLEKMLIVADENSRYRQRQCPILRKNVNRNYTIGTAPFDLFLEVKNKKIDKKIDKKQVRLG